jgi:putative transcriptional regulator
VDPPEIQRLRRALGLTQQDLARLFGIHSVTVSKWELGQLFPSPYQTALLEGLARSRRKNKRVGAEIVAALSRRGIVAALCCALRPGDGDAE